MKKKVTPCAVLFLISLFLFLTALNSNAGAASHEDLLAICCLVGFALVVQGALVMAVRGRYTAPLCAVFVSANALCLYLVFMPEFDSLPLLAKPLILCAIAAVGFLFFLSLYESRIWAGCVIFLCALLPGIEAADFLKTNFASARPASAAGEGMTSSPNIRTVKFSRTPNVYFISFDALAPETIVRRMMRVEVSYEKLLRERGFHIFRNGFADGFGTKQSFNRLAAMDPAYYQSLAPDGAHHGLISGFTPAPLFEMFKFNGYETSAYFYDNHLGAAQGPHTIDRYVTLNNMGLCERFPLASSIRLGFFGYCSLVSRTSFLAALGLPNPTTPLTRFLAYNKQGYYRLKAWSLFQQFFLKRASQWISRPSPQFILVYFPPPGHAGLLYDHRDWDNPDFRRERADFAFDSRAVPGILRDVLNFIKQNDPGAFVYVFGDHGVWITKKLKNFAEAEARGLDGDFIHDRYGAVNAFHPYDECAPYMEASAGFGNFATPSKVTRAIVRCLADGQDPFIKPVKYGIYPEFGKEEKYGYKKGDSIGSFEDYLYE